MTFRPSRRKPASSPAVGRWVVWKVVAGKYGGGVIVVGDLSTELEVEPASDAARALDDGLALLLEVPPVVKADSGCHASSSGLVLRCAGQVSI